MNASTVEARPRQPDPGHRGIRAVASQVRL